MKRLLPTTYLLITLVINLILHFSIPVIKLITLPWNLLGLLPLIAGIAINLVADAALHKAGSTVRPFQESSALITGSVYRISRHPMYLGFVLVLVGVTILLGSLSPWVVIPIFIVLMERLFIRVEEQMLEAKFGETWSRYKHKVRKWI
jgi:protein-S-isoprenylcysteine O-methyltransferase Ste14